MNIISLNQVSHSFGGPKLLDNASIQIESGSRICLLGRNGAGKSTLLHLLNDDFAVDSGEIIRNQGVTTAYVQQELPTELNGTVRDYLQTILTTQGVDKLQAQVSTESTLSQVELDPNAELATLSGGLKRRVLLAAALVQDPDLLLLDEPTNHLDIAAICWLETFLLRLRTTLVFISHDRTFTNNLANQIIELDRGQLHHYRCNYTTFMERRQDVLNSEAKEWARLDQKLAEEEVWIRKGIKARRTRNMGRVRDLHKLRDERRQRRQHTGQVKLQLETGKRSGQMVIEAEQLGFSYGDKEIISNLDLRIIRGDRLGLIGTNGSGKTTLLKLLTEELQPTAGSLRHGTNLQIAYFDQLRDQLDEDRTVKQNIADDHDHVIINDVSRHIYGYLQDFLFTPDRARTPVRVLSGGEKNRLLLAKLFTRPANLLILDEPTNDLDMETLDLLEELLLNYNGTVLLVSHDRSFLNNVVTSSLVFAGNGHVDEVIGGFEDWQLTQGEPETPLKKEKLAPVKRKERAKKISFKQKQELENLPAKIDSLETEQTDLHEQMAHPDMYKDGGGNQVAAMQKRLQEIEEELETAYLRWDELEQIET